ncbi:MAG: glycoside hydrolase family 3 C-terminal domain-containing protein [Candidatus Pseudobacter hemicellulosilyticus]|uniref:Glycoside hydrolase family 3 C-terminal domain-containing protein n=1 Tax=Candidatus Pseudobacter hemicellulosilyticus TaxID=3121375 RepID=A0AAJ5WSX3_9BACT|nr:MAG: glycoside hydrolase family 3 C-terminal domain-containing protein [Pseudobacter sp.]
MKLLLPFLLLLVICQLAAGQDYRAYPMWNEQLPVEQRVKDLVGRLTLEEKVAQMLNAAPAVPRLGIPAYDWWNEVLHGVARTPFRTTVFPQAIGMAATFDTASLHRMADISATEGRAIQRLAVEQGRTSERYLGLTYWTPNINIFRDPRWGRGQETYGEDPFLTASLGSAFVRGLQGDDPNYLKAAACAKHYAVHSGPEPSRHEFNAEVSPYDLWDTYLPAFKELVTNAKVAGVMCAYNAFRKAPCCASDELMNDILRRQWQFNGYVTSDCWAIDDFFRFHKTHPDATTAAADAVLHGTDVECGVQVYKTLVDAVKKGLLTEQQLDISLHRLFSIRYRLGMFDAPENVPYALTPASVLESDPHKAHALKMAQQSIVLLKNAHNTLPLSKQLKKIAVLGPNADNNISVLGNYNGLPSRIVTILEGIREKLGPQTTILYEKAIDFTTDTVFHATPLHPFYSTEAGRGVSVAYFNNTKLEGDPVLTRTEKDIDCFYSEGTSPAPAIKPAHFSARYTTYLTAPRTGSLTLEIEGDDGFRFYADDKLLIDAWQYKKGASTTTLSLQQGQRIRLVLEYWQGEGNAQLRLRTGQRGPVDRKALLEKLKDVDAIIFAGGISPELEGEEMPVQVPGFKGGDRTSIQLPAVQTSLLKTLQSTGKRVVFVLMTGSAIALPWEQEQLPAILNAWYGGQSAGTAIADVLFGDYNPAGRLPVTFYKSDADLPDFNSYDMKGRTYRYFSGTPLYPFGYGLSYTSFRYDMLKLPATIKAGQPVTIEVRVTNTGKTAGEEVTQLYLSYPKDQQPAPLRALKGFQRLALQPGESRTLQFVLSPEALSLVNANGQLFQPKGGLQISVGGGQPGMQLPGSGNVLTKALIVK